MVRRLIGVDVGGTAIKMGTVEVGANIPRVLATETLPQDGANGGTALIHVARRLRDLMSRSGWDRIDGAGVGSAGLIRRDTGEVAFSPNLPTWTGTRIGEALSAELGVPVAVDNDVNAFALAEWRWGAGRLASDVVFLTLGTGIGGAIIAGGTLLRGWCGFAGEPGHATLVLDGIPCPCGNRGCAERYVGTKGLIEAARRHPGFSEDEAVARTEDLTPLFLSQAAAAGSRVAGDVLAEAGRALGGLLVSLVNIANPERVVIGGGVAQAGDLLLGPAREHLARHSLVARYAPPAVLPAALGESAGLLGAAALALGDESPLRP